LRAAAVRFALEAVARGLGFAAVLFRARVPPALFAFVLSRSAMHGTMAAQIGPRRERDQRA
jgi:hypothetical protein